MEKVLGIGGIFFRCQDPQALSAWYLNHLGIDINYAMWRQETGPAVFVPYEAPSGRFSGSRQQWMINFRVKDLDAMVAQLRAAGIEPMTREEWNSPEMGRFARIHDPEGNPVELWEPSGLF